MSRITEIEIAGRKYPLNFSVRAAEVMAEWFGGLENIEQVFSNRPAHEMLGDVRRIIALLIEQGVAYRKLVDGVDAPSITADELGIILSVGDTDVLKGALLAAMRVGMKQTVETEPDPKNGDATPDQ